MAIWRGQLDSFDGSEVPPKLRPCNFGFGGGFGFGGSARSASPAASVAPTTPVLLPEPEGYSGGPAVNVYRSAAGVYSTDLDIDELKPAVDVQYYWDPVNGADGNSGLTPQLPKKTLSTMLALAPTGSTIGIDTILSADVILRTTASWHNVQPTKNVVLTNSTGFRIISAKVASATVPTYAANATYPNVYEATVAAPGQVIDVLKRTIFSYVRGGVTYTVPEAPLVYGVAANKASVAAVSGQAGSWYHDGTKLYVRAFDDRDLSIAGNAVSIINTTTGNNGRFGATVNGLTIWAENIDFVGGSTPFLALTTAGGNTGSLVFKYASFQGSHGSGNGLAIQGKLSVTTYRCGGYFNAADGFNYHSFNNDAGVTLGTSPTFTEIQNYGLGNGTTGSSGTSDNASTGHDRCVGKRIGCIYANSDDRVVVDIDYAMTHNCGVIAGQAVQQASGKETFAALNNAQMWLDGCVAIVESGQTNPPFTAAGSATLKYRNMGTVTNAPGATGTVAAY